MPPAREVLDGVAAGAGGSRWPWSRFTDLSSWTSCESSSFRFVTWLRRCSILRRRSSSSCWASEGETAVRGRASTGETDGDPSRPYGPRVPAGEGPTQDRQRNPAKRQRMIRVIGIPTGPTYLKDRHRSGQGLNRRRWTTTGITPRVRDSGGCAILSFWVNDMDCFETNDTSSDGRHGLAHPHGHCQPCVLPSAKCRS